MSRLDREDHETHTSEDAAQFENWRARQRYLDGPSRAEIDAEERGNR